MAADSAHFDLTKQTKVVVGVVDKDCFVGLAYFLCVIPAKATLSVAKAEIQLF